MKKLFAALLAVMMVVSMATVASAETTTLTTTVPDASYTLNVPKEVPIAFGAEKTEIGNITVTESSGFAEGKDLKVTLAYDAFASETVSTTIPYTIMGKKDIYYSDALPSGSSLYYRGTDSGSVNEKTKLIIHASTGDNSFEVDNFAVVINSSDWGKALGGNYTATITYTAEVVVE